SGTKERRSRWRQGRATRPPTRQAAIPSSEDDRLFQGVMANGGLHPRAKETIRWVFPHARHRADEDPFRVKLAHARGGASVAALHVGSIGEVVHKELAALTTRDAPCGP